MVSSASLGSASFFSPALSSLQQSYNQLSNSTARLSSGNRLQQVSDDVASFSLAARLKSQVSALKQASSNTAQASSLLQTANGGLSQISDILDRLGAISTQANSSSLSTTDRSFLQQEFSQLLSEIDGISSRTKFGNVSLLDGSFSGQNYAQTGTSKATKATASLVFTTIATTNTVKLNGQTFTADTNFNVAGTLAGTIDNLVTALNNSTNTAISGATYARTGSNTLTITFDSGGKLGNQYYINQAGSSATFTTSGSSTATANYYSLSGGLDDGLSRGSVTSSGTIGDSLVNTQNQTAASATFTITGTVNNGETLRIDDGSVAGGYRDFTFATAASGSTQIQIGTTTAETLQNAINKLTQYSGTDDYGLRQLEFTRSGDSLIIKSKLPANPTDLGGAALAIATTVTNSTLSAATLNNATTTGVDTSGVTNGDFVGKVQGFAATYTGANAITSTITVGSDVYSATISDTAPVSASVVRFNSATGGYFDVQLAAGGAAVTNQATANTFAARLNSAFAGLTFSQSRSISNFTASGSLVGASAKLNLRDFSSVKLEDINVTAPPSTGSDGVIDLTINGTIFRSASGIKGSLGAYESLKFTSLANGSDTLTFTNGATAQDFSTSNAASTFQSNLRTAFGLNSTGAGVYFQVGETPAERIQVIVGNANTDTLFSGATPSVSTQGNAQTASTLITTAQTTIRTILANVGAYQERFDLAANNLSSSILALDNARSALTDTDIASESTRFATETLKVNSAIAVIAQASKLQSSFVNLLQNLS